MSLTDQINEGIKNAMRAKEKEKLEALRAVKAALLLEATKGGDKEVGEAAELQILMRLHKQRKESSAIYSAQGRADLAAEEDFQAGVIEAFLPKQMTVAEIEAEVKTIIADTGASTIKDMGKVMGLANQRMAGRADGKTIAIKVRSLLNA